MARSIHMPLPTQPSGSSFTPNRFVQAIDYSQSFETPDPKSIFEEYTPLNLENSAGDKKIMFSREDLGTDPDLVQTLVLNRIYQGITDPDGFCAHACNRHGSAVISEICETLGSINPDKNALRIQVQTRKGVPEHSWGIIVSSEHPIHLNTGQIWDGGEVPLPVVLSALLRYDSENLIKSPIHCDPNYIVTAFAMAGVPAEFLFADNPNSAFYLPISCFPGLTIEKYHEIYEQAYLMSEDGVRIQDICSQLLILLGHTARVPVAKGWNLALSPVIIFASAYKGGFDKGFSTEALNQVYKSKLGGPWYTNEPVTAFGKVYATRPGVSGKRSMYHLLNELGIVN